MMSRTEPPGEPGPREPHPSEAAARGDAERRHRALSLLRLLQLFDSQFPVGAFAHSGGIETYASLGGGLAELRDLLQAQIALGWGRSELAAAHLAWRADGDQANKRDCHPVTKCRKGDEALVLLAGRVDALKVVPAVRNASIGLGRRMLELLRRLYPEAAVDVEPPHHAIVVGAAGRRLAIGARELLLAHGQSLAMGTLTAALRCMPVSPAQAQGLLAESHDALALAVERALADPEGALFTCTPALDIRSHEQAFLRTRLFQS
jgi:urease accessory protein